MKKLIVRKYMLIEDSPLGLTIIETFDKKAEAEQALFDAETSESGKYCGYCLSETILSEIIQNQQYETNNFKLS